MRERRYRKCIWVGSSFLNKLSRQMNDHGTAVNRQSSTERQRRANYTGTFHRFAYLPTERENYGCEGRKREYCVASTSHVRPRTTITCVYEPRKSGCSVEWIDQRCKDVVKALHGVGEVGLCSGKAWWIREKIRKHDEWCGCRAFQFLSRVVGVDG